jgi:hypothetical protein
MQNYGFENGIPGTLYNKGIKAKDIMIAYMAKRLESALRDEIARKQIASVDENPSIITKFLMCLAEEGYDVCKDGCTSCASYFSSCVLIMF